MFALERILLPVDFSDRSYAAGQHAKALACRFHSELHVLHVLDLRTYGMLGLGMDESTASEFASGQRANAARELESFLADDLRGLNVERVLLCGDPAREIVKYAHHESFGLIVLPTHGYGPFRQFLLGSVIAKVLHDADCPVWTGVHMENAPVVQSLSFHNVLCAIDLGPHSGKTLSWAWQLTQELGSQLTIVHALRGVADQEHEFFGGNTQHSLERYAREKIVKFQEALGIEAPISIETGDIARAVSAVAGGLKADLMVIGRGVASGVLGRLRTHSYAIIRQSPCPVVSV